VKNRAKRVGLVETEHYHFIKKKTCYPIYLCEIVHNNQSVNHNLRKNLNRTVTQRTVINAEEGNEL